MQSIEAFVRDLVTPWVEEFEADKWTAATIASLVREFAPKIQARIDAEKSGIELPNAPEVRLGRRGA